MVKGFKDFEQLFEKVKLNAAKAEILFLFLGPDSSIELYEEYVRLEEEQYELYSEMIGIIIRNDLTETFLENMLIILKNMEGLESSIFESKHLIEEMKAA